MITVWISIIRHLSKYDVIGQGKYVHVNKLIFCNLFLMKHDSLFSSSHPGRLDDVSLCRCKWYKPVLLLTFTSQMLREPERVLSRDRRPGRTTPQRCILMCFGLLRSSRLPLCVRVCKCMQYFFQQTYVLVEDIINLRGTGQVLLFVPLLGFVPSVLSV